jgi:cytidyltransferase-like protein
MIFNLRDTNDIEIVRTYIEAERQKGRTSGLASGTFDLLHPHHTHFLERCRRECDILVVGVDSDLLVKATKGPDRPQIYDAKRMAAVDSQKQVTFAFIINSIKDFGRAAEIIRPNIIFKNNDFQGREAEIEGKEFAGKIMIIPDVVELTSTSQIIAHAAKTVVQKTS